jgi:hypothetical protein
MEMEAQGALAARANTLTWRALSIRLLGGYVLFEILSQIFFPLPQPNNWTPAQKIAGSVLVHLTQYFVVLAVTSLFAVLIVKASKGRTEIH